MSVPVIELIAEIHQEVMADKELSRIMQEAGGSQQNQDGFHTLNGHLYFKGRVVVAPQSVLKHRILKEFHDTPVGGHAGILRTYQRLKQNVFWKGMKRDVELM